MHSNGLSKQYRLTGKTRFNEMFDRGATVKSKLFVVRALPNGLEYSRFAPVAGKAAGKAFYRNRLKRRIRSAFRSVVNKEIPAGYDFVFIARRGVDTTDFGVLAGQMCDSAKRAIENLSKGEK